MSEPPSPALAMFEHYCEHPGCIKWGCFGFENRRMRATEWFCLDHRPSGYLQDGTNQRAGN